MESDPDREIRLQLAGGPLKENETYAAVFQKWKLQLFFYIRRAMLEFIGIR